MQYAGMAAIKSIEKFYEDKKEGLEVAEETIKDLQEREKIHTLSSRYGKVAGNGRNGGIRTLGIGVSAEFIQKGFIDIRRREIQSP
jgi:hypothetical protein